MYEVGSKRQWYHSSAARVVPGRVSRREVRIQVAEAQHELRTVYLGGFVGQLVSGALWLASAAFATWGTHRQAILLLVLGGMFTFPLTQLGLKLMGRRASLDGANPLRWLATQVAFTVPLSIPLVGAAALYRLAAILIAGGVGLGLYGPPIFAVVGRGLVAPELAGR